MLRHPDDRAIAALAVPALGALAADPLYSLADTAMVGRLGAESLAAVAIGTAAFTASFWIFSFLAYGVTPQVAQALGRRDRIQAANVGVQALIVAVAAGLLVMSFGLLFAPGIVRVLGGTGEVGDLAVPYLRLRVLSASFVLVAQVGHGWLRGAQKARSAMHIAVVGAGANVILDYLLIYPAGLGVRGAALATVVAQAGTAIAFILVLRPHLRLVATRLHAATIRALLSIGSHLVVRTGSLLASMTFATALAARMGTIEVAAWQIAMQIFLFLALTEDSLAIAAQALVATRRGAGNRPATRAVSRRLMEMGLLLGIAVAIPIFLLRGPLAGVFSDDAGVLAEAARLIAWVGLVQPVAAVAFTLDGILIGALETRWLAGSMIVASLLYAGAAWLAYSWGWGVLGLALAATMWLTARVASTGYRYLGDAWLEPR